MGVGTKSLEWRLDFCDKQRTAGILKQGFHNNMKKVVVMNNLKVVLASSPELNDA